MDTVENKLKTANFWLWLGAINHTIVLAVLALGCLYSGFSCRGEAMKDVLSTYTFTLFTPQVAFHVIIVVAIFLANGFVNDVRRNWRPLALFCGTLALLLAYVALQ